MSHPLPEFYTVGPLPEIDLGFIQVPTYYLIISITYCVGIYWFYRRCEARQLSQKHAMDIGLIILIMGFLGARLFHILFEYPSYYIDNPSQIFAVWQGGFVFYGGFLTAYAGAYLYARRLKLTFWLWHDTAAPVLALGYAMGRVACFLVGCCYGKVCDLPWAVPVEQVDMASNQVSALLRHPTQLYATGTELLILGVLLIYEKKRPALGNVFLLWVGLHSLNRLLMESLRDDPRGIEVLGLSLSSFISIILLVAVFLVFMKKRTNDHPPSS